MDCDNENCEFNCLNNVRLKDLDVNPSVIVSWCSRHGLLPEASRCSKCGVMMKLKDRPGRNRDKKRLGARCGWRTGHKLSQTVVMQLVSMVLHG